LLKDFTDTTEDVKKYALKSMMQLYWCRYHY